MDDNDDRQDVKAVFVNFDKRAPKRPHGLKGGLVDESGNAWLDMCRIEAWRGDPLREPMAEWRPEQIGSCDHEAGHQLNGQEREDQGDRGTSHGIVPDELLRLACEEGCGVAPHGREISGTAWQYRIPPRMAIAEERPHKTPEKIDAHDIAERRMNAFQQYLAVGRKSQIVIIENGHPCCDQAQDGKHVDPVEQARRNVPCKVASEFEMGALSVGPCHGRNSHNRRVRLEGKEGNRDLH